MACHRGLLLRPRFPLLDERELRNKPASYLRVPRPMSSIPASDPKNSAVSSGTWPEVLAVFLKLGLTSFGGPVAHLGYFHAEVVERRRWLDERAYGDLVALCQFLPGPASSQVGIGTGLLRAGVAGAFAAWVGFTLPSALAMVLFAYGLGTLEGALGTGWLHGLKIAAVAVVAQAVWAMAQTLAPDRARATLAALAAVVVLLVPSAWGQVGAIAGADRARLCARLAGAVLCAARCPAAALGRDPVAGAGVVRQLLSLGFAGVRRRPRGAAAVAGRGGAARLGDQRRLPRRLRRRAGGAGPALHLRGLSGRRDGAAAERLGWRRALSRRGLSSVVSAGVRRAAVLGRAARRAARPGGAARHQCGGGGPPARRALSPGVDQCDRGADRFRTGDPGVPWARAMEAAALARGGACRGRGWRAGTVSAPDLATYCRLICPAPPWRPGSRATPFRASPACRCGGCRIRTTHRRSHSSPRSARRRSRLRRSP